MVTMRTVKVLGCFRLSELKLMRDAMAPAMAWEALSAGGRAAGAAPWRRQRLRAAPSPASERRLAIGSELGSSRPPPRGSPRSEANQKRRAPLSGL